MDCCGEREGGRPGGVEELEERGVEGEGFVGRGGERRVRGRAEAVVLVMQGFGVGVKVGLRLVLLLLLRGLVLTLVVRWRRLLVTRRRSSAVAVVVEIARPVPHRRRSAVESQSGRVVERRVRAPVRKRRRHRLRPRALLRRVREIAIFVPSSEMRERRDEAGVRACVPTRFSSERVADAALGRPRCGNLLGARFLPAEAHAASAVREGAFHRHRGGVEGRGGGGADVRVDFGGDGLTLEAESAFEFACFSVSAPTAARNRERNALIRSTSVSTRCPAPAPACRFLSPAPAPIPGGLTPSFPPPALSTPPPDPYSSSSLPCSTLARLSFDAPPPPPFAGPLARAFLGPPERAAAPPS